MTIEDVTKRLAIKWLALFPAATFLALYSFGTGCWSTSNRKLTATIHPTEDKHTGIQRISKEV